MTTTSRACAPTIRLAFGAAAAFALLTRPLLPALPLSHLEQLGAFLQHNGPVVTAAAGLRLVATVAAAYVLLIALLALMVTVGRPSPRFARCIRAVTLPMLRFALPSAFGLCLLAVPAGAQATPTFHLAMSDLTTPTTMPPSPSHESSDDDLVLLDAPRAAAPLSGGARPSTTRRSIDVVAGGDEVATFRVDASDPTVTSVSSTARPDHQAPRSAPATRRPSSTVSKVGPSTSSAKPSPRGSAPTTSSSESFSDTSPAAAPAARTAPPAIAVTPPGARTVDPSTRSAAFDRTWTVRRGDHLWRIAHDTLAARLGHQPVDAEVVPYWEQLIETNRPRLVDPNNPDLIFPGQVFTLP